MHFWVADSAAPSMQSMGDITNVRLWLCCAPNTRQNSAVMIEILNTVRTEFDLQAGCRHFCAQSCQHVWRGIWAPSFLGVKQRSALQLARSEPALVAGRRADTADREQRETLDSGGPSSRFSLGDAIRQDALPHRAKSGQNSLEKDAQQLGRTQRKTRDIVFTQQHWQLFVITRKLRGFVVVTVGGIVTVSEREAASQQLHKANQQCAGTRRDRTTCRVVRTAVWCLDV